MTAANRPPGLFADASPAQRKLLWAAAVGLIVQLTVLVLYVIGG